MPAAPSALDVQPARAFPGGGPGLYANVPPTTYHHLSACSSSRLTLLKRSPAHARHAIESGPDPSTKAQRIGTAAHAAILEPGRAADAFAVAGACSATTNAGTPCSHSGKMRRDGQWFCGVHDPGAEEAGEAFEGLVVTQKEGHEIDAMQQAVRSHAAASHLLSGGEAELTVLFDHPGGVDRETGEVSSALGCKARLDYYDPSGAGALVDLKTTRDASAEAFQRTLFRNGYFRQLAFYRYALRRRGQQVGRCLIVAVEKEAPFAVAVYEISETTLKAGKRQLDDLLIHYAECEHSGQWPGYSGDVQAMELPHWAWDRL